MWSSGEGRWIERKELGIKFHSFQSVAEESSVGLGLNGS